MLGLAPAAQGGNRIGRIFTSGPSASFLMRDYGFKRAITRRGTVTQRIKFWQLTNQPRRINLSPKYRHINLNSVDVRAQVIDLAFEVVQFTLKSSQPSIVRDHRPND